MRHGICDGSMDGEQSLADAHFGPPSLVHAMGWHMEALGCLGIDLASSVPLMHWFIEHWEV